MCTHCEDNTFSFFSRFESAQLPHSHILSSTNAFIQLKAFINPYHYIITNRRNIFPNPHKQDVERFPWDNTANAAVDRCQPDGRGNRSD